METFGQWQLDVNADYYFGQSESLQQVINNGEEAAESTSKVRNYLYAVKAVASRPMGKGYFFMGTEETFTNRYDLFLQSGFSADADNHVVLSWYRLSQPIPGQDNEVDNLITSHPGSGHFQKNTAFSKNIKANLKNIKAFYFKHQDVLSQTP